MRLFPIFCAVLALAGCARHKQPSVVDAASPKAQQAANAPAANEIRVETVRNAEVPTGEVVCPGKIEANPNRVSRVVLPVAGRIATVLVKLGDAVSQEQPLLAIDSPDADAAESAYLQAQASVTQAKSGLVKAQADLDRAKDLFEHNAIAQKEVLAAENALVQASVSVEQAQATQEQTARHLRLLGLKPGKFGQQVIVNSPISGKVLEISVAANEYRNDTNAALMTIADLSTVWVSSDVPESSIRLIQPGERLDITLSAYPDEVFRGRVMRIADTVDPQTRTIKVRAELQNPHGRFRPEMFATIRHTEAMKTLPVLPPGAVIQGGGQDIVFLQDHAGHFRQTPVVVAQRTGDSLPVLKGVKAGDRVVVDGAMLLKAQ